MKIKKGWKITWITLGSLLGLAVLTVIVALWLIFTPSKLTKIVNSLAGNFITCEAQFGNVDLTLLSTFPDAGLKIEEVVIVNPMAGTNDTVAKIGSLTVGIDIKAFLKDNKVIVHQVKLDDADANLYINKEGKCNFDIFPKSEDKDSSSSQLPELIDLKKIKVNNLHAVFVDEKDRMSASVDALDMTLKGKMEEKDIDGDLDMESRKLFFALADSTGATQTAVLTEVDFEADGSMKADDIDAKLDFEVDGLTYSKTDSLGMATLHTALNDVEVSLDGKGVMEALLCELKLKVENGTFRMGDRELVNEKLQASKKELLLLTVPFKADLSNMEFKLGDSRLQLDDYALDFKSYINLNPMKVDAYVKTDGSWQVAPLLDIIPEQYTSFRKGMDFDAKVNLEMYVVGTLTDSTMPGLGGYVTLADGRFYAPKMLPYKLNKIKGKVGFDINPDKRKESYVTIEGLRAHTQGTDLTVNGRVDDLLGDMRVDAKVKGTLPLEDVAPMIPKGMKLTAKGDADLDLSANFKMSQLQRQAYDKVKANGTMKLRNLDVTYDSLHADAKLLDIAMQMPSKQKGKMADVQLMSGMINVENGKKMNLDLENASIKVEVNNVMKEQLTASYDIEVGETEAEMDSMVVSMSDLKLEGSLRLDSTQCNVIKQYNPRFSATTHNMLLYTPQLPETMRLTEFDMSYTPASCHIKTAKVRLGHSDFELYGEVENLEDWLDNKAMLSGDLNFTSSYADVDQLMSLVSGMGRDKDSLEAMRVEDTVPQEANPFIVPTNVDVTLHTHIKRSIAFGNDLHDVAGALTVRDGRVVLDQIGFVCKAATMQLTGLYRSPRPGNLFAALDFHLLNIEIDELIDMIPAIDTLVPMLAAFDGNGNFHLAGETYLDAFYRPKMTTVKGAAAISGENLVVMDNKDLSTIAKFMRLKSWRDKDNKIKIDSLSVEMVTMDDGMGCEIEILPFLLTMGSYNICVSGVQNVDESCVYHLELLKHPLLAKVGVDVKGTLSNPKIKLGKVKYSDIFKPKKYGMAEKKALEIKSKVRKALEANVR